jgi:hypothetical protein
MSSMTSAPVVITGRSSRRYTTSVVLVDVCPTRPKLPRCASPQITGVIPVDGNRALSSAITIAAPIAMAAAGIPAVRREVFTVAADPLSPEQHWLAGAAL